MRKAILAKILFCFIIFSFYLFNFINKTNQITKLKLQVPKVEKQLAFIDQENKKLNYQIDSFINPSNLLEIARKEEFSHLKHPLIKNILRVEEGLAFLVEKSSQSVNNNKKG